MVHRAAPDPCPGRGPLWLALRCRPGRRVAGQGPHAPQLRPRRGGRDPLDQGIEDPWYGGHADFDAVWDQIQGGRAGHRRHVTLAPSAGGQHHGRPANARSRYALFHDPRTCDHRHRRAVRRRKDHPGHRAGRPAAEPPQGLAVPSGGHLPGLERARGGHRTLRHHGALAPEPRRGGRVGQLGLGKALRRRDPGHAARRDRDCGRRRGRGGRCPAPAGRRDLGGLLRRRPPHPGAGPRRRAPTNRSGTSGRPRRTEWLADDDVRGHADVRVLNRADGTAPDDVLQALHYLPALAPALAPELSARRGLQLLAERIEARPDAAALFDGALRRLRQCRLARLLPAPRQGLAAGSAAASAAASASWRTTAAASASPSRTVPAPPGSAPGQRHVPPYRPVLPLAGHRVGPPGGARPEGYPGEFTLGWLGYLGYELKRETGGSDVPAATPDAGLIFAGRAVVLDHCEGTAWLLALDAPDAGGLACARPARPSPRRASAAGGQRRRAGPAGSAAVVHRAPCVHRPGHARPATRRKIADAQHQIAEGNSYEVCLTTTLSAAVPAGAGPVADLPGPAAAEPGAVRQLPALRRAHRGQHLAGALPADSVRRRHARRADQGHPPPGRGSGPRRGPAPRPGDLPQGPGGKHHDRGPAAERPQPLRRARVGDRQPAVRDRKLRHGAPDGEHHRRPAAARGRRGPRPWRPASRPAP